MTLNLAIASLSIAILTTLSSVGTSIAAESELDARIILEMEIYLSECDSAQIEWLNEQQVFARELDEDLEESLSQASETSFYGKTWFQITAMKELKERLGETAYTTLLRGAASRQPLEKREALGVFRYRVYTDNQGRKMKAELLRAAKGVVTAALENGREFTMPVTSLIDSDQKFISQWIVDYGATGASALPEKGWADIEVEPVPTLVLLPAFVPEEYRDGTKVRSSAYQVTLYNGGQTTVKKLRVRYYVFSEFEDGFTRYILSRNNEQSEYGSHMFAETSINDISSRSELTFETDGPHPYHAMLRYWFDRSNDPQRSENISEAQLLASINGLEARQEYKSYKPLKLTGIWLRGYIGAHQVTEFVSGSAAEKAFEATANGETNEFDFQP